MGITKTDIYSKATIQLSAYFKVLGHPARLTILEHLININQCVCGDLVDVIGLAQPTISQHLKELKSIGLIQGTVEGSSICYCINQEEWNQMRGLIEPFLNHQNNINTNCC
ncbi:metalloregulator ArsR/SmtB family transcription factor [Flavobacteriaceae bacterium Ap0902]|nr:metalloregulator ArsR/SmtB family transcription factor [Flavobacteriaceae bacterium Ap0902]